jgi:hypothetical protein
MCYCIKHYIFVLAVLVSASAFSQEKPKPLTKRIIVKTNLLSLIAQRPTITIEKAFTKTFSAELSQPEVKLYQHSIIVLYAIIYFILVKKERVCTKKAL